MATMVEKTIRLPKFDEDKLGLVIGPSSASCQKNHNLRKLPSLRNNVISPAWNAFKLHKEKENLQIDDPKTPLIELKVDDDGVFALVKSESDVMMKFVLFHLGKYHTSFKVPRKKMFYNFYTVLNHSSIPRVIGRQASRILSMRSDAVSQMDEEVSVEELGLLEKSFIKVDQFTPKDLSDFNSMVESNERADFIGYKAEEGDPMVKISVNSLASKEVFEEFVDCFSDVLLDNLREIREKDSEFSEKKKREFQDMEEALNTDYD
tara:strand:+ start:880 stop:1668 length:789 start_codon:yes stop_codon:yes gene_type:complete